MSTNQPAPSGGNPNPSGATGDPENTNPNPSPETKPNTVAYEEHLRLLNQKKKRDEENATLKKELEETKKRETDRVEADLKKNQEWEKIAKLREDEAKAEKDKRTELENKLQRGSKIRSFLDKVNGTVEEQYWRLINLDEIVIDPNTGLPDEGSVVKVAKDFETKFAQVLVPKGGMPNMPNGAAKGTTSLSYEDWLKLPAKEMRARAKEVVPKV